MFERRSGSTETLSIKIAQKPSIIGSLGPKALKYESLEGQGRHLVELTVCGARQCQPERFRVSVWGLGFRVTGLRV